MSMESVVLKTISENTSKEGKTYGIWLMGYYSDGKPVSVKVVSGEKKIKENGDIWYVAKGMSVKDFAILKPHYQEFVKLAANQPALQKKEPEPTQDHIEETPF